MWGLHYLGFIALIALAVAASLYYAAAGGLVALFGRRNIASPWLTAAIWILVEGLRTRWPLGGLAWGELGTALHDIEPARSLASWGGTALVTFIVVAWNAFLLDAMLALRHSRSRPLRWAGAGLVGLVVLTVIGDVTRYEPQETGRLRFAMLQAFERADAPNTSRDSDEYAMQRTFELAEALRGRYDLIVFPESALADDPELSPTLRARLVAVGETHDAVILANARHSGSDGNLYNANLVYDPDGTLQGVYGKQHLVPFGEYVPLRDELSFIGELRQIPHDFTAGTSRRLFRAGGHRFGSVICYESAYSGLVRDFVRDGAEVIVVSTSDRSYRRSGIAAQHLAMGQMRAAETGRPLLQAAISGVSGVIDADGAALATSELFTTQILEGAVVTTTGETPYVALGDWALAGAGLGIMTTAILAVARPRWRSRRS